MLPPLTFSEYLDFIGRSSLIEGFDDLGKGAYPKSTDLGELNGEFINYINYGGYPEAVVSEEIRLDASRYIKNDIIDKVLLRDIPQLYGIQNVRELNNLFTSLAFQTGREVSLESLSQNSGISKPTIAKYIDYLEAAFLIYRVRRIDASAKEFHRARNFKVYLTNASMRAALFAPADESSPYIGCLVETAIFSQWFHAENRDQLYYARWSRNGRRKALMGDHGEIDVVYTTPNLAPQWVVEIKWSDAAVEKSESWNSIKEFTAKNPISNGAMTTKTLSGEKTLESGVLFYIVPSAIYCYTVGRNTALSRGDSLARGTSS